MGYGRDFLGFGVLWLLERCSFLYWLVKLFILYNKLIGEGVLDVYYNINIFFWIEILFWLSELWLGVKFGFRNYL